MNNKEIILVTAANGNTGFETAKELLSLKLNVRAFVRNINNAKAKELKSLGAELFVGNMEDIRDIRRALKGVRRAYFVPVAPPSNKDIGAVIAHILKDPKDHIDKTYRITSRGLLSSEQKAEIFGNILGRKVKVQDLPEKMTLKIFKSTGQLPIRDYAQVKYYMRDAKNGTFAIGGATSVVKDIVGREAEDFETIAKRYIEQSLVTKQTFINKLRAIKNFIKILLTSAPNLDKYEKEIGFPKFSNMLLSKDSKEWCDTHKE
jgi:hypothetical protein